MVLDAEGNRVDEKPEAEEEIEEREYLRAHAGEYYATTRTDVSLKKMSEHPVFKQVPFGTLQKWCMIDKWVDKRREFIAGIEAEIKRRISADLVHKRLSEIQTLEEVRDDFRQQFDRDRPEIKSAEGAMSVYTKMTETLDDMREKAATRVIDAIPDLSPGSDRNRVQLTTDMKPTLSMDEAQEAAKLIIQKRREALRARLQKDEKAQVVDAKLLPAKKKKPPKKVVQK
jgi:hypothetical protein